MYFSPITPSSSNYAAGKYLLSTFAFRNTGMSKKVGTFSLPVQWNCPNVATYFLKKSKKECYNFDTRRGDIFGRWYSCGQGGWWEEGIQTFLG